MDVGKQCRPWSDAAEYLIKNAASDQGLLCSGLSVQILRALWQKVYLNTAQWCHLYQNFHFSVFILTVFNSPLWAFFFLFRLEPFSEEGWCTGKPTRLLIINFSMLRENSTEDNLIIFFLLFLENRIWHFMQIGSNLHEVSNPIF